MDKPCLKQQGLSDGQVRQTEAFVEKILASTRGVFEVFSMYLGVRLGYYRSLSESGPANSRQLAERTGTCERYAREWLEQQAVCGIVGVDDETLDAKSRRYVLPESHQEVLVDEESLNYLGALPIILAGALRPLHAVVQAYRTGEGVAYGEYGVDLIEGQAGMNRAMFLKEMGSSWLPKIPDVHQRLLSDPPARVVDVGTGAGWCGIAIARSYPKAIVDGFDLDQPSVEMARQNARAAGVDGRVKFYARDAADPRLAGQYDLVVAFECIHDMADPVGGLRAMKHLAGPTGTVLVVDERVGERFSASKNDVDWMMYGWSILHCLPVGMADKPSAETGTVMRPDTLRAYAQQSGFHGVEVLPIENYFFRFYRLIP
jgi:2-polyprenyl-3-methyl-5-hydroxy-6-metoxy-1,4-benzoquinol methylase